MKGDDLAFPPSVVAGRIGEFVAAASERFGISYRIESVGEFFQAEVASTVCVGSTGGGRRITRALTRSWFSVKENACPEQNRDKYRGELALCHYWLNSRVPMVGSIFKRLSELYPIRGTGFTPLDHRQRLLLSTCAGLTPPGVDSISRVIFAKQSGVSVSEQLDFESAVGLCWSFRDLEPLINYAYTIAILFGLS